MPEVKGVTWDFDGWRMDRKNALAACYAGGFTRRLRVITAACVMTAESQRWTRAWHKNHEHGPDGSNVHDNDTGDVITLSTDRGLFQINDKAHPQLDPNSMFRPRENVAAAFDIYKRRGNSFSAWAAYNSGAYLKYWPEFSAVWLRGRWRDYVKRWELHYREG